MILVGLFVVFFVGGPLAFRGLTHAPPAPDRQRRLLIGTVLCAGTGLMLRYGLGEDWGRDLLLTVTAIALIWFAWIGVLAFAAQALRRGDGSLRMRRLTGVMGAAGTTMPWFGLASANLVQG